MQTSLYRHFADDGSLLYVGISLSVPTRTKAHAENSVWFDRVCRIEIERFDDRESALNAEREAIANEKPRFNVRHNHTAIDEEADRAKRVIAGANWSAIAAQKAQAPLRVLRPAQTAERIGMCDRQIREMEAEGAFPRRFMLNPNGRGRAVGHLEHEVDAWIEARTMARA